MIGFVYIRCNTREEYFPGLVMEVLDVRPNKICAKLDGQGKPVHTCLKWVMNEHMR